MSNQEPTRVNIQFSIEMDELPSEISRLIQKSNDHINEGVKFYNNLGRDDNLTTETWEEIDNIRRSLAKADQVLDDLQNIIGGYLKMKTEAVQPQAPPKEVPPTAEPESPFMQSHPDAHHSAGTPSPFGKGANVGLPPGVSMEQMQHQMMNVISNLQQNMDNASDLSEEEQQAAEVLKNRLSNMMSDNENSTKTSG